MALFSLKLKIWHYKYQKYKIYVLQLNSLKFIPLSKYCIYIMK